MCEKSFLTGKECRGECAHCRSPGQNLYSVEQLETKAFNAISYKNKTQISFALLILRTRIEKRTACLQRFMTREKTIISGIFG